MTNGEHLLKPSYLADGKMLDRSAAESLFYWAEGKERTLAAATFIAEPGYELGSEKLNSILGPLADYHVHPNLCFANGRLAAHPDKDTEKCPAGTVTVQFERADGACVDPPPQVRAVRRPLKPAAPARPRHPKPIVSTSVRTSMVATVTGGDDCCSTVGRIPLPAWL